VTALAVLFGTAVSLAALGYLAATDPKRRRSFRLPPAGPRQAGVAWIVALAPGALVAAVGGAGGLFVWFGAVSVLGWGIAALPPGRVGAAAEAMLHRIAPARAALARGALRVRDRWAVPRAQAVALLRRPAPDGRGTVAALELRVGRLEEEVAALHRQLALMRPPRGPGDTDVVLELARAAERPRSLARSDLTERLGKG
jgi:hypothetical protein